MENKQQNLKDTDIAIIGMAVRMPGANSISEFWENLKQGIISIKQYTDEELMENEVNMLDLKNPNYVRSKGTIEDMEYFDASFFDYSGREAEILDPQTRLLTELSWHALEDAGYIPGKFKGSAGVYVGITNNLYWQLKMIASGKITDNETLSVSIYSEKDHVSTRISYKLNLTGPSFTVETQCSTSLVSFHLACQGLLNDECDIAIAGGASINLPNKAGYIFQEGSIHSPDGICRSFDDNANGTVFSDGAGLVVLKRASRAIADGDNIYAIVKGSAINNDGQNKAGYTAPSVSGQRDVILRAYKAAGVSPESVTYVEAHGTGTALGDPIEIEALTQAFNTSKRGYCKIGSVKPNIGHLDNAAGIANVIKATLAIRNKQIPPSVNYNKPNAKIKFEETPFVVSTELSDWEENSNHPRRAGVSSYGVGGTNAHVILEEYIQPEEQDAPDSLHLIPISAKTESAFQAGKDSLVNFLDSGSDVHHADVAHSMQTGRKDFQHRGFVLIRSTTEAIQKLRDLKSATVAGKAEDLKTVFLFPGQGAQYLNMGLQLYQECAVFRQKLDTCFELYKEMNNVSLWDIVFNGSPEAAAQINQTRFVQPIIFSFEYALANLLMEAGVKPDYMIGHSIGEYSAACISGVFGLKDAMRLVCKRGEMMQALPTGSMMALVMDIDELKAILPDNISIAAVNSTDTIVLSGRNDAIDAFEQILKDNNREGKRLHTSHAFHSHMMDPILEEFEQLFETIEIRAPKIPYVSNLTGNWIMEEDVKSPAYWSAHLRQAVLFKDGLENVVNTPNALFIEVGPGITLGSFIKRLSPDARGKVVYNTLRHPNENVSDTEIFYNLLGKVWQKGVDVQWTNVFDRTGGRKISLPLYSFERKKYWVGGNVYELAQTGSQPLAHSRTVDKLHNRWIYKPNWIESVNELPAGDDIGDRRWLVFSDDGAFTNHFTDNFQEGSLNSIVIRNGANFKKDGKDYRLNASRKSEYRELFEDLKTYIRDKDIDILHFWSLTPQPQAIVRAEDVTRAQEQGLISILYIVQCVSVAFPKAKINLRIVANNIHNVLYKDLLNPLQATILGAVTTVPIEYKNITVACMDMDIRHLNTPALSYKYLESWAATTPKSSIMALRRGKIYSRTFDHVPFKHDEQLETVLKEDGVYLITGGLGGIGVELATYLSRLGKVKLALLGRTAFPDRSKWTQLIKSGGEVANRIRHIQDMEKNGSQVMVLSGNVNDQTSMQACVDRVQEEFGTINGVLHCAGVAGGNIIQTLEPGYIYETMDSKVYGTLVLDEIINFATLDFVVFCSSISSITGTFGQLSYTSSNAFLDAYTHYHNTIRKRNIVCFNWDIWQEVGMATKAMKELNREDDFKINPDNIVEHPLFNGVAPKGGEQVYLSHLNPSLHWMLNEHRILKQPVLPGATYVEMLGVIAAKEFNGKQFQIPSLNFYAPFSVEDGSEKKLYSVLKNEEGVVNFSIRERYSNSKEGICVKGKLSSLAEKTTRADVSIERLLARCTQQIIIDAHNKLNKDTSFLELGKRWTCLKSVHLGETESVALLEMPATFRDDFADYSFHPAMLDIAFNYFAAWKIGQSEYLPFSYKNLKVYKAVPPVVYSHVQQNEDLFELKETISFKITLLDEAGEVIMSIDEYTLKKVYSDKIRNNTNKFNVVEEGKIDSKDMLLLEGIRSEEGAHIFDQVVSNFMLTGSSDYAQLVVSNNDLMEILEDDHADAYAYFKTSKPSGDQPFIDRPELSDLYEAPSNATQERLCAYFQDYLKINKLGVNDNFFELGISSLDVVEIKIGIEEAFGIDLPVAVIFENPTIKSLGKFIMHETGEVEEELIDVTDRSDRVRDGRKVLQKRMQSR